MRFTDAGRPLKAGLYLVIGASVTVDGFVYTTDPFMVLLPGAGENGGSLRYDMNVTPKYEYEKVPGEKVNCRVIKVWKDQGYEKNRPKTISVQLLQDGKLFDTAELKEENGWRYEWKDLSGSREWTVVEKEIADYTVRVDKEGTVYTVTNTIVPKTPPASPTPRPPKVPQTGMLWWPIPILAAGGLLFVLIGMVRGRKRSSGR